MRELTTMCKGATYIWQQFSRSSGATGAAKAAPSISDRLNKAGM